MISNKDRTELALEKTQGMNEREGGRGRAKKKDKISVGINNSTTAAARRNHILERCDLKLNRTQLS